MGETKTNWETRARAAEQELETLRAELADLREAPRGGRPPTKARSADAMLIARACAELGCDRGALAERLRVSQSLLSRANSVPLAEHHREKLTAWIAEATAAAAAAPRRRA